MAMPKSASGLKLLLKFGDGGSPEVFAHSCSISAERGVEFTSEEGTTVLYDCDDDDLPGWVYSEKTSKRVTFSGSGTLNAPDFDRLHDLWDAGADFNAKLVIDLPGADGGLIFSGAFKIDNLSLTGNRGEKVTISIGGGSSGPVTKAANS
jgi:hypothetical protein